MAIFKTLVARETPPFMANAILNFHIFLILPLSPPGYELTCRDAGDTVGCCHHSARAGV